LLTQLTDNNKFSTTKPLIHFIILFFEIFFIKTVKKWQMWLSRLLNTNWPMLQQRQWILYIVKNFLFSRVCVWSWAPIVAVCWTPLKSLIDYINFFWCLPHALFWFWWFERVRRCKNFFFGYPRVIMGVVWREIIFQCRSIWGLAGMRVVIDIDW
jgi:hypothetical protein